MLSKLKILFWIGIIMLFVPFLGITSPIRTGLTIVLGVLVIWISIRLRTHYKALRFRLRKFEETPSLVDVDIHTQ